jgi:hypothetical protein
VLSTQQIPIWQMQSPNVNADRHDNHADSLTDSEQPFAALQIPYVEVRPLCRFKKSTLPPLTSAFVQRHLIRRTKRTALLDPGAAAPVICIKWSKESIAAATTASSKLSHSLPINHAESLVEGPIVALDRTSSSQSSSQSALERNLLCFPTNDPSFTDLWPCECRGFVNVSELLHCLQACVGRQSGYVSVLVTESTLVRVLPSCCSLSCGCSNKDVSFRRTVPWSIDQLTGDVPSSVELNRLDDIWNAHSASTVRELTLRLRRLLAEPVYIGTTANALHQRRQQSTARLRRLNEIQDVLQKYGEPIHATGPRKEQQTENRAKVSSLFRDGALLVHSPDHGAGKTELIKAIAHSLVWFDETTVVVPVHVIRPEALLARYGIHADAALQSVIHAAIMAAAVRRQPICILIDGLEAMTPLLSGRSAAAGGDAAVPVLHGMVSFLQTLTKSLLYDREVPFPTNNALYNMNVHEYSMTLPVQVALVAVMTCPDNWSNPQTRTTALSSAMRTFRLPSLDSSTRLSAFQWAFAKENMVISGGVAQRLPFLAASAVWARGADFRRLARRIRARSERNETSRQMPADSNGLTPALTDVELEFASIGKQTGSMSSIQFLADSGDVDGLFHDVGGHEEAKAALSDALALDRDHRRLLASLGLAPATGVLLYGPPGTGTLTTGVLLYGLPSDHCYCSPLSLFAWMQERLCSPKPLQRFCATQEVTGPGILEGPLFR